ncbi:hypothetical protein ACLB2K_029653 [Fragaria x ananassa]
MAPFKALYGKLCRTPLCWNQVRERELCGPEIIHDTNEKIKVVRDRLKAAQSRQKNYADLHMKDLEFQVERVSSLAYQLVLPPELSRIHNVFHISMLRKFNADPSHVLQEQPISLQKDLSYNEEPVQILDRKEQVLRSKTIPLVKLDRAKFFFGESPLFFLSSPLPLSLPSPLPAYFSFGPSATVWPPQTAAPVPIHRPSTQPSSWGGGNCPSAAEKEQPSPEVLTAGTLSSGHHS